MKRLIFLFMAILPVLTIAAPYADWVTDYAKPDAVVRKWAADNISTNAALEKTWFTERFVDGKWHVSNLHALSPKPTQAQLDTVAASLDEAGRSASESALSSHEALATDDEATRIIRAVVKAFNAKLPAQYRITAADVREQM